MEVDEEGWFNPLVYDGGARLSPRLKNLQGEELARMPPLRVQERKWEKRFVANGTTESETTGAALSSTGQQQHQHQHELRRFMLTGFMPTCRPAGMILPAGVREMCGQAYVELEVAPACDKDGTPIAWSEAAWPEPAKHRTRLEPWHRKWGDRWASPRDVVGRGLGPGGGESPLSLYYEVPDTNDISELLMHKMIKAGFSTMLRTAPELQYKITRELSSRLDVNIPLVQNFIRMLGKRTLQGRVLPWLAMQQGLAGYIISRSGSPDEREAMLRAAMRWMIRRIAHQTQRADHSDDCDVAREQQHRGDWASQHMTPEPLTAAATPLSAVERQTPDTGTAFATTTPDTGTAFAPTTERRETAGSAGLEGCSAATPESMFVLADRRTVCLDRKRPEFLGVRIFYRQPVNHLQESQHSDMWAAGSPGPAASSYPPAAVAPHTAPPPGRTRSQPTASLRTPRSEPLKAPPPSTGLRSRIWWAARAAAEQQQEDDAESDTEDEEWNAVYYLGHGGAREANAFVEKLREAGEFTHPGNVVTHVAKWPRTAVVCDVPSLSVYCVCGICMWYLYVNIYVQQQYILHGAGASGDGIYGRGLPSPSRRPAQHDTWCRWSSWCQLFAHAERLGTRLSRQRTDGVEVDHDAVVAALRSL